MQKVGITTKATLTNKAAILKPVLDILNQGKVDVLVHATTCNDVDFLDKLPRYDATTALDLLVVVGGDGTILRSVRELHDMNIPIISINCGRIGFLATTETAELSDLLPKLIKGEGVLEERSLLQVTVNRNNEEIFSDRALNEAVIAQGTIARLVDLATKVNGQVLTSFHADGLIIASPTGSTAYSLAAGGPIVHPALPAIILTPINPHSFSQKPVVIPANQTITVKISEKPAAKPTSDIVLTIDGQKYIHLQDGDEVSVRTAQPTVKFLRCYQDTFFKTLQNKLRWGGAVNQ